MYDLSGIAVQHADDGNSRLGFLCFHLFTIQFYLSDGTNINGSRDGEFEETGSV